MKYFTFFELEYSKKAVENNIKNAPTSEAEDNLRLLVENLLDPLRELYGKPIIIGSGFRNEKVNKLVGGVKNSQHKSGCAADLQTGSISENHKLAKLLAESGLPFDQLIDEQNFHWVHVSYKRVGDNRGQILRMKNGKYQVIKPSDL